MVQLQDGKRYGRAAERYQEDLRVRIEQAGLVGDT